MPKFSYSIEVKEGMYILNFESWHTAVENIPDDCWINNPTQRKKALKNKISATFEQISENDYKRSIEKLEQDILKKLDADGIADWTTVPVLVDEIRALIGFLRYQLRLAVE